VREFYLICPSSRVHTLALWTAAGGRGPGQHLFAPHCGANNWSPARFIEASRAAGRPRIAKNPPPCAARLPKLAGLRMAYQTIRSTTLFISHTSLLVSDDCEHSSDPSCHS